MNNTNYCRYPWRRHSRISGQHVYAGNRSRVCQDPRIGPPKKGLNPLVDKIRAKYPGAYDDMDDATLTKKVLAKFPMYSDLAVPHPQVTEPKMEESAIGNVMSSPEEYIRPQPKSSRLAEQWIRLVKLSQPGTQLQAQRRLVELRQDHSSFELRKRQWDAPSKRKSSKARSTTKF
jgi:hypothetical protein